MVLLEVTSRSIYLIHLFTPQTFIKHLLYAKLCSRPREHKIDKTDKLSALGRSQNSLPALLTVEHYARGG